MATMIPKRGRGRKAKATDPAPSHSLKARERQAVVEAMAAAGGHKYAAARLLGITPRGLYNKLIAFGLYTPKSARSGNRRGGERVKKGKPKPKPKPPKPDRYESP